MTRRRALATWRQLPPVRPTWRRLPALRAADATYATDPHKRVIHGESAFGHFVGGADCAGYRPTPPTSGSPAPSALPSRAAPGDEGDDSEPAA